MKIEHVADRALGYGMPGVRVDGNDPLQVTEALAQAVATARGGGGPTFLECVTFRFRGHYFGDRMKYIPAEQLESAIAADPVPRFRKHLIDTGVCGDDELDAIDEGALAAVETALKTVMAAATAGGDELERDVYATPIAFPRIGSRR
jgi:pyruvate dehydrogenase E1 component alpha subunit